MTAYKNESSKVRQSERVDVLKVWKFQIFQSVLLNHLPKIQPLLAITRQFDTKLKQVHQRWSYSTVDNRNDLPFRCLDDRIHEIQTDADVKIGSSIKKIWQYQLRITVLTFIVTLQLSVTGDVLSTRTFGVRLILCRKFETCSKLDEHKSQMTIFLE